MITKKSIMFIAASIFFFAGVQATAAKREKSNMRQRKFESITSSTIPEVVSPLTKMQFNIDFGNLSNVKWSRTKNWPEDLARATFKKNGKRVKAYYDYEHNLVGTVYPASFSDLPKYAQEKIHEWYKNYDVLKTIFFRNNEYNGSYLDTYFAPFDKRDNYFAELINGKHEIILKIDESGFVSEFKQIS